MCFAGYGLGRTVQYYVHTSSEIVLGLPGRNTGPASEVWLFFFINPGASHLPNPDTFLSTALALKKVQGISAVPPAGKFRRRKRFRETTIERIRTRKGSTLIYASGTNIKSSPIFLAGNKHQSIILSDWKVQEKLIKHRLRRLFETNSS
jgi:hypothetical protein